MNKYEHEMVENLRNCLSDVITPEFTDFDFLRWLKEGDYDFDRIVPDLRHHFRFLRSYDFSISHKYYPILDKYWTYGLIGLSGKDDNVVSIDTLGRLDPEGIAKTVPRSAVVFHRIYKAEEGLKPVRDHEKQTGRQSGAIFIIDLEGSRISTTTISGFRRYMGIVSILTKHYKDVLQKSIVVNTPTFTHILWNVASKFLPEKMKQRFIILGSNWKKDILQHVSADTLPVHWGGNVVDENNDPMCRTKVVVTSKVPSNLYWHPSSIDPTLSELTLLTIPPRSFEFVTFPVQDFNKCLEFWYYTDKDWGFGIFYTKNPDENDPDEMEMVYPQIERFPGHTTVIENEKIVCEKPGIYKLWFSNAFSWVTKLRIKYKVEIRDM